MMYQPERSVRRLFRLLRWRAFLSSVKEQCPYLVGLGVMALIVILLVVFSIVPRLSRSTSGGLIALFGPLTLGAVFERFATRLAKAIRKYRDRTAPVLSDLVSKCDVEIDQKGHLLRYIKESIPRLANKDKRIVCEQLEHIIQNFKLDKWVKSVLNSN